MESQNSTQNEPNPVVTMGKFLVQGIVIGAAVYAAWVIVHMTLFGVLG